MAKNKNKRFDVNNVDNSMSSGNVKIIVDRQTGVNYLYYSSGYSGGLTPLLDSDGKVIVTPVYSSEE